MSATGAGYDQSVSTFSPNGRVFQVEYAAKALEKSGTCLGFRCIDGIVLAVEKTILHKMLVPGSNKRISAIDEHTALAQSGLAADARQLVNHARSEAAEYLNFYGTPITGKVLSERVAGHVHAATLYWYLRPYGCAVLIGSVDPAELGGPSLYSIEPSGECRKYFACAIGKSKQGAQSELEKLDFTTLTCAQAVNEAARILYKMHDSIKEKELEIEITWINQSIKQTKVQPVPQPILQEAIRLAKEAKQRDEMEEDSDDDDQKD